MNYDRDKGMLQFEELNIREKRINYINVDKSKAKYLLEQVVQQARWCGPGCGYQWDERQNIKKFDKNGLQ